MSHERVEVVDLINVARKAGARQAAACGVVGISAKTYQRWNQPGNVNDDRLDTKREPANKLTELERKRIVKVVNEPEYANLAPSQIVPILADQGCYMASEASIYRILKQEDQLCHRQKSKPINPAKKPRALTATGPNQIYTWDITYLPTRIQGVFLYLYLVLDIYSR